MSDLQKRIAERVARAMARAQTSGGDWNWPAYLPEAGVVVAELAPELLAAEAMTQLALAIKGGLELTPAMTKAFCDAAGFYDGYAAMLAAAQPTKGVE